MDTNVLFWVSGAIVGLGGLALLWWALFADRSRGRRRCPKCWYDMSKAASPSGMRCPECGCEAKKERALFCTRRRWKWAFASLIVLAGAAILEVQPKVQRDGWASVTPTTLLILALRLPNHAWALDGMDKRLKVDVSQVSSDFTGMLVNDPGGLTLWQWQWLGRACARIVAEDQSTPTRLQALSFLSDAQGRVHANGRDTSDLRRAMATLLTDPDPLLRSRGALYCAFVDSPEESLRLIAPLTQDADPNVREWATIGMRLLCVKSDVAVPMLLKALEDPVVRVRMGALGAIGNAGAHGHASPEVVMRLEDIALHDPDNKVRQYAPKSIARFSAHRDEALRFLLDAAHSHDDALRAGAFEALWYLDPGNAWSDENDAFVQTVVLGLSDPSQDARQAAAEYLEQQLSPGQLLPHANELESLRSSQDQVVAAAVIRKLTELNTYKQWTASTQPAP